MLGQPRLGKHAPRARSGRGFCSPQRRNERNECATERVSQVPADITWRGLGVRGAVAVNPYEDMAEIVRMPKLSDTMTEGVVAKWNKKVGDAVKDGRWKQGTRSPAEPMGLQPVLLPHRDRHVTI